MNSLFNLLPNGADFLRENFPELYRLATESLENNSQLLASSDTVTEELNCGEQDTISIKPISINRDEKSLLAKSIANFSKEKGAILIVSELIDRITGKSIGVNAVMVLNACSLSCTLEAHLKDSLLNDDSQFYVRTGFYWSENDQNGNVKVYDSEVRRELSAPDADSVIIVGDFFQQNNMQTNSDELTDFLTSFQATSQEFKKLIDEINKRYQG